MIHHNTIRSYTAMLLDLFNDLEIQYQLSNGDLKTTNVPVTYSSVEKIKQIDDKTLEQLLSGNTHILPRASLALSNIEKNPLKTTNKNLKKNTVKETDNYSYSWNSVAYNFDFQLAIMCRGMNELCSFIEQIAPRFNPTIHVDVSDAENLNAHTRVAIKLNGFEIESDEYDQLSSNIFTLVVSLTVEGYLYPAIREIQKIKEYKIFMNETDSDIIDNLTYYNRKDVLNWDVNDGKTENYNIINVDFNRPPEIVDLVSINNFGIGSNELKLIVNELDGKTTEDVYEFTILRGGEWCSLSNDLEFVTLVVSEECPNGTEIEIQSKVTDVYGNYDILDKVLVINI